MVYVDELKDRLNLRRLPDEEERNYETLGGLVMTQLGRIPTIADAFEWEGYRFEVVDMDGKRVDRVLITPIARREAETTSEG
jgi:putative hemolysin